MNKLTQMAYKKFHAWSNRRAVEFIGSIEQKHNYEFKRVLDAGSGPDGLGWPGALKVDQNVSEDVQYCDLTQKLPFGWFDFDLVICSNVLEHIKIKSDLLREFRRISYHLYLSFTPWYSPWGGHEFSPWHYFGKRSGSIHTVGVNLFKTTVKEVRLKLKYTGWTVLDIRPRYYPFPQLAKWPSTREWATWNIQIFAV